MILFFLYICPARLLLMVLCAFSFSCDYCQYGPDFYIRLAVPFHTCRLCRSLCLALSFKHIATFSTPQVVPDGEDRMMDITSLEAIYSVQRMAEVLVHGPDSEREFILFELQQLLDHCLEDTMKILIPVLCEHVPNWNIDLQIKSAQRLYDVVYLDLDPATANMITCASFGVIHRSRGRAGAEYEELYNLWGGLLVDCLPNMQWSPQEIRDVIALVDIHSKETLFTSRKVAARVVGALAQCLDKNKIEKVILPRAISLFDDVSVEVRGTVVESLATIGAALPIRVTEAEVWPRVERLVHPPEEARIRATAMRTLSHILEAHRSSPSPNRLFRELLPPVFATLATFSRKYSSEDQRLVHDDTYLLLEVVSEVFGQFSYSLALFAKKSFRKEAYKAYAGMSTCNGPLIRRNCAFNFPGVAKALGERYAAELSGLCDYLANDMDEQVRSILAAGIHETAALLAPRGNFDRLFGAVCQLLQDESPSVRMNALAHFYDLLSAFAKEGNDQSSLKRLAPVFTDLTVLSDGEWRIQRSLAEQLGKCADIIPSDALLENVLPLLYRLTKEGTPLVREAAMDAVIKALRNIPTVQDCKAAIDTYWKAASHGPFWMRLAMLDGGASAMKVFSHKRFSELFADDMLRLSNDPVANVRIRVASLLAEMAPMCYGSPSYVKALETLRNDRDVDVLELIRGHEEAVRVHMKVARERQSEDQVKYKEEQEYFGLTNRTQKRVRGRLASTKGNRIMPVRRPSLDQSSGHLSVSKSVISAAKTSSAAASAAKPGYQLPLLTEPDPSLYLGSRVEDMLAEITKEGMDIEGEGVTDTGEEMILQNNLLSTLTEQDSGLVGKGSNVMLDVNGSGRPTLLYGGPTDVGLDAMTNRKLLGMSGERPSNGNVPVVQRTLGRSFRNEARSKSWNGILPQFPRQLSAESRNRKIVAKVEDTVGSGWNRQGKDGPKRKLSTLRRKKKRGGTVSTGDDVTVPSEGRVSDSTEIVEHNSSAPRVIAARAKSMMQPNGMDVSRGNGQFTGVVDNGRIRGVKDMADLSRGRLRKKVGDVLGSIDGDSGHSGATDQGLPTFRGHAPWLRQKQEGEDLEALSEAAHRKAFGVPSYSNGSGIVHDDVRNTKHARASGLSGPGASGSSATSDFSVIGGGSGSTAGSVDGNSTSGNGGFLRGLFRRRR